MKFIVAGLGFGEQHLAWLSQCREVKIVGIYARNESARAKELAARFGDAQLSTDLPGLIRASRADALVVVTTPESHAPLLHLALNAGLTAISDKPLTEDVPSAQALVAATSGAPSKGIVTFQWRHHPGVTALRRRLADGAIGSLSHLDVRHHHEFLAARETGCPWRHRRDKAGAGTLGDQGVHLFDLMRFITGLEWSVVTAVGHQMWATRSFRGETIQCETEDVADVTLRANGGPQRAFLHTSRVATGIRALQIRVYGTAGTLELDLHPDTGSGTLAHRRSGEPPSIEKYDAPSMNPYPAIVSASSTHPHPATALFADGLAAQSLLAAAASLMQHHQVKDLQQ